MRLIDADALVEDFEKVYEFYMNEIKEANENPDNYTSKFLPATAGAIDGLVDAEIAIHNAPTIESDGDLISRQDVIDEIKALYEWHDTVTEDRAVDHLKRLPTIEPDGDTISRRAAILAITGEPPEAHYPSWYADRIKSLPSAPDSRQRGEWKRVSADKYVQHAYHFYRCDKCGYDHIGKTNFCPNCGARMYKGGDVE